MQTYASVEQDRQPSDNPHTYGQLVGKWRQELTMDKRQLYSIRGPGKTGQLYMKK